MPRDGFSLNKGALGILYTTTAVAALRVRVLAGAKANPGERAEIRRRALYLRYFLRRAFAGFKPARIDLKLAFYLDSKPAQALWYGSESLFHPEEWIDRDRFWNELCPGADPERLFTAIRTSAAAALQKNEVVPKLRTHFVRPRMKGSSPRTARS